MQLGVLLLVEVPDSWCILLCTEYQSDRGGSPDLGEAESDLKFLRMKPTVLFPLAATVSAWFVQERSTVMVTPKYLLDLATTSCCPWRWSVRSTLFLLLREIRMVFHLLGLKLISQVFSQFSKRCMSCRSSSWSYWFQISLQRRLSSANGLTLEDLTASGRSLMYARNGRGPKTVVC